jgi:H+/gluconate symporter-like permease
MTETQKSRGAIKGLVGKKVDSINFYNEKIKDLSLKLEMKQKFTLPEKQVVATFIIFNNRRAAVATTQVVHSQTVDIWTTMVAPEPHQVVWKNLTIHFYQRMILQNVVYVIVFLIVVFYMIHITLISTFTTLDKMRKYFPFLKSIEDKKTIKRILEAYLPQFDLILFLYFLPTILMILSKAEGIPSESHAVRASSGKYFYFIVFNVFFGVTIGGTILELHELF